MTGLRVIALIDRSVASILRGAQWLVLPVVVLLFLQWPLRDIVRNYSREANDLGQWLFALYVAASVTAATRAGTHLAADVLARGYPGHVRSLLHRLGAAVGLLPWAVLVVLTSKTLVLSSIATLEAFPDTVNPGYFLIKVALWVLAGLVFAQALIDIALPSRHEACD